MSEYMISYDLRTRDEDDHRSSDYGAIEAVLTQMGAVEVLESQWFLTSETASAKKLSKELQRKFSYAFRVEDRLLVCLVEVDHDRTWFGTSLISDP